MPVDVKVYSRKEIESLLINDTNIDQYVNDYFICVNSTGHIHKDPYFKKEHRQVLNLSFDDTAQDSVKFDPEYQMEYRAIACTVAQAEEIKKFVDDIPNDTTVHIYCTKGKSRSPAIAKYVVESKNKTSFETSNYNEYVYNLLCSI